MLGKLGHWLMDGFSKVSGLAPLPTSTEINYQALAKVVEHVPLVSGNNPSFPHHICAEQWIALGDMIGKTPCDHSEEDRLEFFNIGEQIAAIGYAIRDHIDKSRETANIAIDLHAIEKIDRCQPYFLDTQRYYARTPTPNFNNVIRLTPCEEARKNLKAAFIPYKHVALTNEQKVACIHKFDINFRELMGNLGKYPYAAAPVIHPPNQVGMPGKEAVKPV